MPRVQITAIDLAKLWQESDAPIYVLDEDRQIVFCNTACARWVGIRAADLLGRQCAYHAAGDVDRLKSESAAIHLCPPPKAFSGQVQTALVCRTTTDGGEVYRRGQFIPLGDGQDESSPVLAILETSDCQPDALCGPNTTDFGLHEHVGRFRRKMASRFQLDSLIGASPAMVRARAQVQLASQCRANVLILGPPGCGKDHVAKAIHYARAEPGTLVPLTCAVLETNLLRATLRALWAKNSETKGPAGTLLLEDADAMAPEVQSELTEMLRGDSLRMRVIATAVRPLAEAAAQESFSHELACALSTMTIELPPLGQRLEDLPLLAQVFLEEQNAVGGKQVGGFSAAALDRMAAYHWPGNLDELAAIVRQSHELAQGGEIAAGDLPHQIDCAADVAARPVRKDAGIVLEEFLARVERELIERALRRSKGNKSKAAKLLGLTRPRLYRRLVQLGMEEGSSG